MSYNPQTAAGATSRGTAAGQPQQFKEKIPKGYKQATLQNFTPEMMDLFKSLFSHLGPDSYLSRLAGGDESFFEEMEQPAWRKFQEAQGELGSRFSQLAPGAMSAQRGSGFQNASTQMGSDFAMNLASQRQQLKRQALMDLMGLSSTLLSQKPFERSLVQRQPNFWESLITGMAPGIGEAAGAAGAQGASSGIQALMAMFA